MTNVDAQQETGQEQIQVISGQLEQRLVAEEIFRLAIDKMQGVVS